MNYKSTRDGNVEVNSAIAITLGLSSEGGLFIPQTIPTIDLKSLSGKNYIERAKAVLSLFLTDFTPEQIDYCVRSAYNDKFDSDSISEIAQLGDYCYMLELWHGPTCAFKDMALQLLPYLLTTSAKIIGLEKEIVILVATSGDTGKAALDGFSDVPETKIIVFYPQDGVSPMQKRQMTTQIGSNVEVVAINGNFDDAQNGVKAIFTDNELKEILNKKNIVLSSANSINWGRLVPQIVYYISAYIELCDEGKIAYGDRINVVVPTGNFGNILAAYYAKRMGVPIKKFICASNENNVLTDFINTGIYNKNREFITTISPSMDILISSNLERLIYELADCDTCVVNELYNALKTSGEFKISPQILEKLQANFYGGCCNDAETQATIKHIFDECSYVLDTHTAVAVKVYEDYRIATNDTAQTIIASTANPYKFTKSVLEAVDTLSDLDEYEQIEKLYEVTKLEVPTSLSCLKDATVRFDKVIEKTDMKATLLEILKV